MWILGPDKNGKCCACDKHETPCGDCPAKPCPSDTSACPSSYILKLTGNFPWWPTPPGGLGGLELQWLAPGKGGWTIDQGIWVYPFNVDEEGYFQSGAYVWLVCYGETWGLAFEGEPGFSVVPQKENTNDCPALGAYSPIVILDHPEWTGTATLEEVAP